MVEVVFIARWPLQQKRIGCTKIVFVARLSPFKWVYPRSDCIVNWVYFGRHGANLDTGAMLDT